MTTTSAFHVKLAGPILALTLVAPASLSALETGHGAVLVVPVVLSSGGAAGSFYTSELALTNRGTTQASLGLRYTAAFGEGSGTASDTLLPGEQKVVPDAIAWLRELGVPIPAGAGRGGTVELTFSGLSAPDAVAATVRTTTATAPPQPAGAAGLAYPALGPEAAFSTDATIYGLRASASDRSNVAIYNPTPEPVIVRVTAHSGDGSGRAVVKEPALEIAALGWSQLSSVFDGTGITNGWVTVEKVAGAGSFGAYGVVNDNDTSDGSFVFPVGGGIVGTSITVPVLVETTSGFSSELVLTNRSDVVATLTLRYVESLTPTLGTGGTCTVELPPGTQLILPDAIDYLRGEGLEIGARGSASFAGSLAVDVAGATLSNVFVGARTSVVSPVRGRFGLFTPGVYAGQEASTEAFLYGLRADALNRSNVAVLNAGADTAGAVALELQAFDGDAGGLPRGNAETISLEPGAWAQFSGFLGSRGVSNGWVRVMRTAGTAHWVAYAVVNDGGSPGERTGDGAYVPMAPTLEAIACSWELSAFSDSISAYSPSLAFDPQGRPAIGFLVLGNKPQTKLARWDPSSSSWDVQGSIPGSAGLFGFDPADGHPSFISNSSTSTSGTLDLVHGTGSGWKTETIDDRLDFYNFVSARFAPGGAPSASYTPSDAGVRFATRTGATWAVETVDSNGGWFNSLDYDPEGNPAIAYTVGGTDLMLARKRDGVWQVERLTSRPGESTQGWYLSLAFDRSGRPAIAHRLKGLGIELLRWDGDEWLAEMVAPESKTIVAVSLAFDASGRPLVAFGSSGRLWIAEQSRTGGWNVEQTDEADLVSGIRLVRDPEGAVAGVYSRVVSGLRGIGIARQKCP